MLKIWLTWLQPSLGVLGLVFVFCNTVYAQAASKIMGANNKKVQSPQIASKSIGTDFQQRKSELTAIGSEPPDVAVRRLAMGTIADSERQTPRSYNAQANPQSGDAIASVLLPSNQGVRSGANTQWVKHSVAHSPQGQMAAANPAPSSAVIVPGLFIGTTASANSVARFRPASQSVAPVVTKAIVPPTPSVSATDSTTVAEAFPVLLPEQLPGFSSSGSSVVTAKAAQTESISIARGLQGILGNESNTAIAPSNSDTTVATGLQQFLGNEPNRIQTDSIAPVARAIPRPMSPNGANLYLATSEVYSSAAKFDMPTDAEEAGVKLAPTTTPKAVITNSDRVNAPTAATKLVLTSNSGQAIVKLAPASIVKAVTVNSQTVNLSMAVVERKNNTVSLLRDKPFKRRNRQSWQTVSQGHNLGGLILGSRASRCNGANEIAQLPMNVLKASGEKSLALFNSANQY
jgi:hypothetical protein